MIIAESLLHSKVKVELVLGKCKTIGVTCVTHGTDTGRHLGAVTSDKGCKGTCINKCGLSSNSGLSLRRNGGRGL